MRLGFHDASLALECAQAMQDGGACEIVVHAHQARWLPAARVLGADSGHSRCGGGAGGGNGEIWTVEDAQRCRAVSGCDALMLGRGMVADPGLARACGRPMPSCRD